ncbi:MAG TPA: AI-2E family transporter [Stellaceae bacterium]|jgi:predicted PurR-regulated permease PerM
MELHPITPPNDRNRPPTGGAGNGDRRPAAHRFPRSARVATAAILLLGLWILHDFLPALAWAAVFAIATWPLYQRFERAMPPRGRHGPLAAPLVLTLLIGLIFAVPLTLAAVEAGREAHTVVHYVAEAQRNGIPAPDWVSGVPIVGQRAAEWWNDNLGDPDSVAELIGRADRSALMHWTRTFGVQLVHRLTLFLFTLLTLFFLYRDGAAFGRRVMGLINRAMGSQGERLAAHVIAAVHGTVNGLVLVGLGEGALMGIAYVIAGVPHPVLFGALTAVLAIVPFGAPVMFGAAALSLIMNGDALAAAIVLGLGLAMVFVADHFIRPALIGGAVRLPFLWVLLGILGGLETFGLLGLFLGPAVMAALISLWRDWTDPPPPLVPSATAGKSIDAAQR